MQDPISSLLTGIRNAQARKKSEIVVPSSTKKIALLELLVREGYIDSINLEEGKKPLVSILLKYYEGKPVIREIKRMSKPGLREYVGKKDIPQINGGLGIAVVSTSKGLMTDKEAREAGLGGELLCSVFWFMAKTFLKPINIPSEVSLSCEDKSISVKGKLGELELNVHPDVNFSLETESISFSPTNNEPETLALTGTMRALTKNIIEGVDSGYEKKLEINGVGYRAKLSTNKLELSLGFSHAVEYQLPEGVTAELPSQTEIVLKSTDKQKIGQVAAEIRNFRPPEPYKGKGVKYSDEIIRRKESKKA